MTERSRRRYAERNVRTSDTLKDGTPTIARAKDRVDIYRFLEQVGGVRKSNGTWAAFRCPFHDDTRASGQANKETGYFVCFACDARGDVVDLAKRHLGTTDVKEALRWLGQTFRM